MHLCIECTNVSPANMRTKCPRGKFTAFCDNLGDEVSLIFTNSENDWVCLLDKAGGPGARHDPVGRRWPSRRRAAARAAVPRPAPLGLAAGAGRRWPQDAAGRDQL